jgi:polysaccharide biosynthesis protein PslH
VPDEVPKPARILIAASRRPWPARRGDQIRSLQVAGMLSPEHRVTLLVPEGADPPEPPSFEVATYPPVTRRDAALGLARASVGRMPFQSGLFRSPALGEALARLAPDHDLVILQLVRLAPFLDRVHSRGDRPVLVDLVDSLAVSTARRAELDRRLVRLPLREEARRLARWERLVVRRTAGALVVSGRDRGAIAAGLRPEEVARLHVVPVAAAETGDAIPDAPGPPTLVLTGNLGYFPTREGLGWWLAEVWPRLRARRPELRLEVAGSRPGRALRRALARSGAALTESPEDLAPFLRRATVALAPMRGGAGQPMKVVEAWAAGVPVVATPWTAAGTTGVPGEDLLVADDPEAWCRQVLALVDDPERRARIAASARERLRRDYAPASVAARLREVVAGALRRP